MITTLEQGVEHYFGEILRRFNFQLVFQQETKSVIYQSEFLRLRITETRADTDIYVSGLETQLDPEDARGWYSIYPMLDFLENRRSVAHLFDKTFDAPYSQIMHDTAERLNAQMSTLLTWFKPEGRANRLAQFATYDSWKKEEMKGYRRANRK